MREGAAEFRTVADLGLGVAQRQLGADEVAPRDVIDHPGHRIRAIDGGSTVAQHLDALQPAVGQLIDVGGKRGDAGLALADRMGHQPPTIEQNQGVAGGNAAQRDTGIVAAGGGAERRRLVARESGHLRHRRQEVGRLRGIAHVDLVEVDDAHRQGLLVVEAPDVGSGDGEGLQLDDFLFRYCGGRRCGSLRGTGRGGKHQRERGGDEG